jgi:hypothetical protein
MPFGISIGFLLCIGIHFLGKIPKLSQYTQFFSRSIPFFAGLVLFAGMIYLLPWAKGNLGFGGRKPGFERWYQDYIEMGEVIGSLDIHGEVILGGPDRTTNDIIPSLSQKVNLVSFRNERGGNTAPIWEAMVDEETKLENRVHLFREFQVKYLLIRGNPRWLEALQTTYPDQWTEIHENRKLKLLEFSP